MAREKRSFLPAGYSSICSRGCVCIITLPLKLLITAIVGSVLAGFVCSLVGIFVLRMNLSSIGFCMSHAAFAGAAFGLFLDVDPLPTALGFTLLVALLLGPVAERAKLKADVIIGVLFSSMMALGFIFLSMVPGEAASGAALRILWGSIFSVDYYDLIYLGVLAFFLVLFIVLFYKEILSVMFNRKLAEASGINTEFFYFSILFFTGFAVALSLKLVGGLLVYALIINPSSTVYQFSYNFKKIIIGAPVVGIVSCLLGFYVSLETDFPIGSSIVIVSSSLLAVAIILSPKRKKG